MTGNTIIPEITISKQINTLFRYCIFSFFAIISLSYITAGIQPSSQTGKVFLIALIIITTALTWRKPLWIVYGIPLCIPVFSTIQTRGYFNYLPLLSFFFSIFFLAWFSKQIFLKKSLASTTGIGVLTDLLAALVIISLAVCSWSTSINFSLYQLFSGSFPRHTGSFFILENTCTLLLGLFYFRIIELEIRSFDTWKKAINIIYLQTFIIIVLYFTQPFLLTLGLNNNNWTPCFPFEDIHSYGSCLILLLFIVAGINKRSVITLFLIGGLLLIIFMTESRATIIALLFTGLFFLIFKYFFKKKLFTFILIMGLIFTVGFSGLLLNKIKSNDSQLSRYDQLLSPKKLLNSSTVQIRLKLWQRALNMVKEHPVTGTGIGSYIKISNKFNEKTERKWILFKDNAHNYYLQLASELGIFALLLWLSIIFLSFKKGLKFLSSATMNSKESFIYGLLFGVTAYILTMFSGHPLLLPSQQLFFWFYIAILAIPCNYCAATKIDKNYDKAKTIKHKYFNYLTILFFGTILLWSYVNNFPKTEIYGMYRYEYLKNKSGNYNLWRWTMKEAKQKFTAKSDVLNITITANTANSTLPEGLQLKLFQNGRLLDSLNYINGGSKILSYYVPGLKNNEHTLRTNVSRTFNPYHMGTSNDNRDLGVMINKIKFQDRLSEDGIGLYRKEKSGADTLPEGFQEKPAEIRWTGMRASMYLPEYFKEKGGDIFLKVTHPDVQQNNVKIKIMADSQIIIEETFSDHSWKKITLTRNDLADTGILTLILDRTWNPKLAGQSNDTRDLGAAVLIPE